jgi:hypothetical protein
VKYATSQSEVIANLTVGRNSSLGIRYFIPDMSNRVIRFSTAWKAYTLNVDTKELTNIVDAPRVQNTTHKLSVRANFSIQNNEIPGYDNFNENIELFQLDNGQFRRQVDKIIPLSHSLNYPNLIVHSDNDFFVFFSREPDDYSYLKAGKINRKGEWIIEPEILYSNNRWNADGNRNIGAFSFYQSDKNETTFAFSDRNNANEENIRTVMVYRLNANLEKTDSVVLNLDFPRRNFHFNENKILSSQKKVVPLWYDNAERYCF